MTGIKTPRHLWVVGILGTLWSAMGALDYVMTQTRNPDYMAQFTPEQLDYFYGFPAWVQGTWAIAVWAGVIGCILLLFRSRFAVVTLLVSLIAMVATAFHNFILADVSMAEIAGTGATVFSAVIFIISALLLWYAWAQRAKGVLR